MALSICVVLIFFSCKKAKDERYEANKPPVAIAGPDHVISLPADIISLDGSASSDPDGNISEWLWKKIEGAASFNMRLLDMSIMVYSTMQEAGVLVEL